jgi:hypothetical protein
LLLWSKILEGYFNSFIQWFTHVAIAKCGSCTALSALCTSFLAEYWLSILFNERWPDLIYMENKTESYADAVFTPNKSFPLQRIALLPLQFC